MKAPGRSVGGRTAPKARPSRVGVPIDASLKGRLVRRYKRFLADIELPGGKVVTVHCPNPGSMLGLQTPGSAVRCSTSDNPKRKLRHTLEMIRVGRVWVGLHTLRANQLAAHALSRGAVPGLHGYSDVRREVAVGGGSRLDFQLAGHRDDPRPAYVEVKSVTLCGEGEAKDRALFPDAVTERGRRHMQTLERLQGEGSRAAVLFVVQRADCREVRPADEIDPAYGDALRSAARKGVEVFALQARITARRVTMERMLPVLL
jgi:sugar fermentation stimulation protein A